MYLRHVALERYGSFGSAEFTFRRGLNLISGANDSGKSLLLAALPAAFCGIEQGVRLRTWGELLGCRVTLTFADGEGAARLSRDLESNLVRIEEQGPGGRWRECFSGIVAPLSRVAERGEYLSHLQRLFAVAGEADLRALLDAVGSEAVLTGDGRPVWSFPPGAAGGDVAAAGGRASREAEIAVLEGELQADREDYRKGQDYLAWIRKRWQGEAGKGRGRARSSGPSRIADESAGEQRREKLRDELRRQGLPAHLPPDLPAMFEAGEKLRQELAALQQEMNPVQRRRQAVVKPDLRWPVGLSGAAALLTVAALVLRWPLLLPWAGSAALLLGVWLGYSLFRLRSAGQILARLDQELQLLENRRGEALLRQKELADRFEEFGLPSSPVDMVKLQQLCRRNEELILRYQQTCADLGGESVAAETAPTPPVDDGHLRPEDLPEAEARLAALAESLHQREQRLAALRASLAAPARKPAATDGDAAFLKELGAQLGRLTGGRYDEVRLDEGVLQLAAGAGRWLTPQVASRSTFACLVLAVRMMLLHKSGCRLPLAIDDQSLLLDQKRRQPLWRTLERFGRDGQVVVASSDEELVRRAGRDHWHIIDLDRSAGSASAAAEEKNDAGQLHLL